MHFIILKRKVKDHSFASKLNSKNHQLFQLIPSKAGTALLFPIMKGSKSLVLSLVAYHFKHENEIGRCFKLETSNNSINL